MRITDTSSMEWKTYQHPREGTLEVKTLARGSSGLTNFNFTLTRYGNSGEDPFETPRHKHTFEQFRMPIEGPLNYGPSREIPEGWVSYFPADAFYGPQKVERCIVLLLQFGQEYLTSSQYKTAHAALAERGEFHDGIYTDTHPGTGKKRNQDAVNAVFEESLGRPLGFAKPRYPEPVLMDPDAFHWRTTEDDPGVEIKRLGTFTERDASIAKVRWSSTGTFGLAPDRTQLVVSLGDGMEIEAKTYPALTGVTSDIGDETALNATAGTEAMVVTLPQD